MTALSFWKALEQEAMSYQTYLPITSHLKMQKKGGSHPKIVQQVHFQSYSVQVWHG